jgi:hypothetical protein
MNCIFIWYLIVAPLFSAEFLILHFVTKFSFMFPDIFPKTRPSILICSTNDIELFAQASVLAISVHLCQCFLVLTWNPTDFPYMEYINIICSPVSIFRRARMQVYNELYCTVLYHYAYCKIQSTCGPCMSRSVVRTCIGCNADLAPHFYTSNKQFKL